MQLTPDSAERILGWHPAPLPSYLQDQRVGPAARAADRISESRAQTAGRSKPSRSEHGLQPATIVEEESHACPKDWLEVVEAPRPSD